MYDCEYVLYYFIALHVYEQITIVYSFQKIKKNILKIHYLKTFIRCIIMNALISNIQLKWILSWMAFFHVQVNAFIYFFSNLIFDCLWFSFICTYLTVLTINLTLVNIFLMSSFISKYSWTLEKNLHLLSNDEEFTTSIELSERFNYIVLCQFK